MKIKRMISENNRNYKCKNYDAENSYKKVPNS